MEDEDVLQRVLDNIKDPTNLSLELLQKITENFSEDKKIGEGGFGVVYKGVFRERIVAVKRIHITERTVNDKLFRREFASLWKTNHRNVVRFLGFCSSTYQKPVEEIGSEEINLVNIKERLLVFEYISNGSLDRHITDELRGLEWERRYEIITGICEGLSYLHKAKNIIHMDLKPQNILIDHQDEYMVPKITDFGLSIPNKKSHSMDQCYGTLEYMAPEYREENKATQSCDIYSLGLIIIELVTGCKEVPTEDNVLRRWRHRWKKPPTQLQHHQVTRCIDIAGRCRNKNPAHRPSISKINNLLSEPASPYLQTSRYQDDDMLLIDPLELHFSLEHKSCAVELTNETISPIAFNFHTLSKQYITLPDKGIVLPRGKRDVQITMQRQESAIQLTNDDKIVVQSTKVADSLADEHITGHMFKNNGDKKVVDNVNLTVVYEHENYQMDLSLDQQEMEASKDIGSSSYDNTGYMYFNPLESISRNLATSLTSDRTVDLATGAIGSLIPKLSVLLNKCNLETSIRSDVDCVIEELTVMRVDLCNVSQIQLSNNNEPIKLAKSWAGGVRELSYDIEDVVDGFLMHIEGSEPPTSSRGLMSQFKFGSTSHNIGGAIKGIKNLVQKKADLKGKYKVEEVFSEWSKVQKVANTVCTINPHHLSEWANDINKLVGINNVMKDFTDRLRNADVKELRVHSIFGIGGLGKSTLARAVYNQLKGSFRLMAFVPVGRNPDMNKFLYDILFEIDQRRCLELKQAELNQIQLINILTKLLKNNRYLIVIDDLWDKEIWQELLKFTFPDSKCGSKIIITTRKFEVASIAADIYKLEPLSHGYSKELFCATLSPEEGICDVADDVIGKILSKCGGVPLAIITIASLLDSKQRDDWPKVYNSIGFGPGFNRDANNIKNIIMFSYSDLPRHLRTCLLHLSIYPEDKLIEKDTAIWMWVAEGFVDEEPGIGLFEVGERYFNQLASRSMIQLVMGSYIKTSFRIHDLVLDMICSLSKDENFVTVLETDEQHTYSNNIARRLAIQKRDIQRPDHPTLECMVQLRSFYATDCRIAVMPPLSSFEVLRVLSLEDCKFSERRPYHLEHIGKLLQLRYLGLGWMPIHKLPEEIGNLLFLQTLILDGTKIKELPGSVGLLTNLKCLRAFHCKQLLFPDWLVNMTSLEDLSLKGYYMRTVFAEGLGKLKELRDLEIMFEGSPGDGQNRAFVKSIGKLLKLQSLHIIFSTGNSEDSWECFAPLRHLHTMTMNLEFTTVPSWMDSTHLPSISFLDLALISKEERCLEILGRLPKLHTLKLRNRTGPRGVCTPTGGWLVVAGSGAFPWLMHLLSWGMLRFQRGVMPRLEYLELIVCVREMEKAHFDCDFTSLGNLPSLQKVKVDLMSWTGEGTDPEYVKRMEEGVKHAVNTHPLRRPAYQLLS